MVITSLTRAGQERITVILLLFLVTSKVRDYSCQNSNYITVTDTKSHCITALLEGDVFLVLRYLMMTIYIFLQEAYFDLSRH